MNKLVEDREKKAHYKLKSYWAVITNYHSSPLKEIFNAQLYRNWIPLLNVFIYLYME